MAGNGSTAPQAACTNFELAYPHNISSTGDALEAFGLDPCHPLISADVADATKSSCDGALKELLKDCDPGFTVPDSFCDQYVLFCLDNVDRPVSSDPSAPSPDPQVDGMDENSKSSLERSMSAAATATTTPTSRLELQHTPMPPASTYPGSISSTSTEISFSTPSRSPSSSSDVPSGTNGGNETRELGAAIGGTAGGILVSLGLLFFIAVRRRWILLASGSCRSPTQKNSEDTKPELDGANYVRPDIELDGTEIGVGTAAPRRLAPSLSHTQSPNTPQAELMRPEVT